MKEKHSLLKTIVEGMDFAVNVMNEEFSDDGSKWPPSAIPSLIADYWRAAYNAYQSGEPVAWINFGIPTELFWAMDIVPIVVDSLAANASAFGFAHQYNDLAAEKVPEYLCSNNTVLLGSLLAGDASPPDIMIHPANPCDSNLATYPVFSEYFGFPYFLIDMPYITTERSVPYVVSEYKKLIPLLEEKTGRRLDYDRLRQAMAYSNMTHEYVLKLNELRAAVPCPFSSMEVMGEIGLVMCLTGTPQAAEYFEKRYEFVKAMVERGEGYMPRDQEKLRVVWIYGAPVFDYSLYDWSEKEYGAVLVSQMNNNYLMEPVEDISDIDHILIGLSQKLLMLPMLRECGGPWENYLNNSIDLLRRYKADVGVFGGNTACKANWAVAKLVKDRIQEELGIPVCNLELDLFDDRVTSLDSLKAQLGEFFTMVLERKLEG